MAERHVGEYLINLDVVVPSGTQPVDFTVSLIDNNEIKQTKVFIFPKSAIGAKQTLGKAFKITEGGEHTIYFRGFTENPWGKSDPFESKIINFELIPGVIPIDITDAWVVYEDDKYIRNTYDVQGDFEAKGWNIIDSVGVEERSEAGDEWADFHGKYANNPAICVFGSGQTPIYVEGAKFWGMYFIKENSITPGQVGYVYKGNKWINGQKQYDGTKFAFLKLFMQNNRPVILCWTDERFDTGDLRPLIGAWRYAAELRSSVMFSWYIFNNAGDAIDHE